MQAHLTPIQQTLLQLLRRPTESRPLPPPVDLTAAEWEALLIEAGQQDVMPLLHYRLQSRPERAAIPAPILERLQNAFLKNTAYISLLYRELQQILSACEQEGIPVILLKGSYLAKQIYPEIGLRPMSDMDLMVQPRDLPRAGAITERLGYTPSYSYSVDVEMVFSHQMPLYNKGGIFAIEWHWHITEPDKPYELEPDELWERAIPMQIEGIPCFGLAPEDLFLHLAYHLTGHHICTAPMRALVDIDLMLGTTSPYLDWQVVIDRARRWRLERCVYLTLRLVTECFGTPLPDGVLTALVPEQVEDDVMSWAYEQIFAAPADKSLDLPEGLVRVRDQQGLAKRLRVFWNQVFLPPQALSWKLHVHPDSPALWRYYPLRIWILIEKYSRQVLRLWRKDPVQQAVLERLSNRNALKRWLEG